MLEAIAVNDIEIRYLDFDGNRTARIAVDNCSDATKNILINGDRFKLLNVLSHDARCGSAAGVQGKGFIVSGSYFYSNGFPAAGLGQYQEHPPNVGEWSDGLTVWACSDDQGVASRIENNEFLDNTDVDLVVGGGVGACIVSGNTIAHVSQYGFAGIHVGWFPGGGGDHSGITYSNNSVSANTDTLGFGIIVGFHPWDFTNTIVGGASVQGNQIDGVVVNLAVDGIKRGSVVDNTMTNARGHRGFNCTLSADYTAGDFSDPSQGTTASLQPGWVLRTYHPCQ